MTLLVSQNNAVNHLNHQHTLNRHQMRTLALAALGGALEYYDFIIFIFYASTLSILFFPSDLGGTWALLNTYAIFAIAYFVRPVGGIMMAHFGDLFGRKRLFTVSLMMMALATLGIGLLPTFIQFGYAAPILLLLMRFFQGIAVGGEIPSAHVFVSEHVHPSRAGFANSVIAVSLTCGVLIGAAITWLMSVLFSEQQILAYAWRLPFILGGIFGLIAVYLRRYLRETPVFIAMKLRRERHPSLPLQQVLRHYRSAVIISMLLAWLLVAGVVLILLAPSLMKTHFHWEIQLVNALSLTATGLNIMGGIFIGLMCDRFGVAKVLMIFCPLLAMTSGLFYHSLGQTPIWISSGLYLLSGFFVGIVACVPYVMVRSFPAPIRLSGMAFSYNLSYAFFAGLSPFVLAWLGQYFPLVSSYYVILLCVIGAFCGLYLHRHTHIIQQGL